jgi:hypothetical protein
MLKRLATILAASPFGVVVACSGVAAPPDANVSEFCDDWAVAICQLSNGPCYFSASVCVRHQTGVCMTFVASAQSESSEYSQANGKSCIDALHNAYGDSPSSIPASTLLALNATCTAAFVGTKAAGDSCSGSNDCAGKLVCAPVVGTSTSQCTSSLTPKQIGDVCADPGDQCDGDSYCALPASGSPKCVPTPAIGDACSASVPCDSANHCVKGICEALAPSGDACASNDDCATHYCDSYPPAQCTNGLTFARGAADCNGIAGQLAAVGAGATPQK